MMMAAQPVARAPLTSQAAAPMPALHPVAGMQPAVAWPETPAASAARTAFQSTPALAEAFQSYWGANWHLQCLGASTLWTLLLKEEQHWHRLDTPLNEEATALMTVRLCENSALALVETALGSHTTDQLTALDGFLIRRFLLPLANTALQHLVDADAIDLLEDEWETAHLVWLLRLGEQPDGHPPVGKLVVSLPLPLLRAMVSQPGRHTQWLDEQLQDSTATLTLVAGSSRLSLDELRQLEPDDIVLLEQSHRSYLSFWHPSRLTERLSFPYQSSAPPLEEYPANHPLPPTPQHQELAVTPSRPLNLPTGRGGLWDDLQIDVHAQFAPTRIPLRQLRQMSEGLVVEVGDLLHNEVQLVANGKALAKGHLVMVGDKFGVLVTALGGPENPATLGDSGRTGSLETGVATTEEAGGGPLAVATAAPLPVIEGVDARLVQAAQQVGLDAVQVVAAAQQQGVDPQQALQQMIQQRQQELGQSPENVAEEVARANAVMDEVDRVLNEDFDEPGQ